MVRSKGRELPLAAVEQVFDTEEVARGAVALEQIAERVRPVTLTREQLLPVLPALESLLPGGALRRGTTVAVQGVAGATSLALALAAEASATGSWVAAVGLPSLGLVAAAEMGMALERLVLVAAPDAATWATVVAALVDGFDVLLVRSTGRMNANDSRRLIARARERGAVLVQVGGGWAEGADVRLDVASAEWQGLGEGHGHLRARRVTVQSGGRRDASRPRRVDLWLPAGGGGVEVAVAEPIPMRP
jgi:hypothetical protein